MFLKKMYKFIVLFLATIAIQADNTSFEIGLDIPQEIKARIVQLQDRIEEHCAQQFVSGSFVRQQALSISFIKTGTLPDIKREPLKHHISLLIANLIKHRIARPAQATIELFEIDYQTGQLSLTVKIEYLKEFYNVLLKDLHESWFCNHQNSWKPRIVLGHFKNGFCTTPADSSIHPKAFPKFMIDRLHLYENQELLCSYQIPEKAYLDSLKGGELFAFIALVCPILYCMAGSAPDLYD